ncbi:SDR family NAD(P)-dependent oxidoreductase [[Mycobacterium] vasticus]|uniref:SDR family oxidoreductase n=1 Tax=[Mycobacterium] vasticus TaxID=2875777 RepID=A0ABU5Z0G5_9MYCO|nr:SDR family oxidoreductase [Mycolicibacter sp. MYC017]MEB3070640.1 SDR family oxidoreductase [Mycolicibacter sp. MYC017]
MGQLDGKVAVITGAGTGLGAATAKLFAREGAAVTLVGRRVEKLRDVATAIDGAGGRALVIPGDVSEPATATRAAEDSIREFGGIDVLVNNAGLHAAPYLLHETPLDEWDRFLAVDLTGPFLFTRAVLPSMMERRDGAIVNIGSMVALVGFQGSSAYAAAKGGLVSMTRTTAVDYAQYGIRANCVCPGGMEPVEYGNLTEDQLARLHEAVELAGGPLLNRLAHVDEVAQFLLTLVGPGGRSLTGAVIPYDGGFTAK